MNKAAIKNFAIWARVQLIEAAKQRAYEYEITEDGEIKSDIETIGGRLLSKDEKEQRKQLIEQIRQKGYTQVMEEAAYTWFNRFIALRFMEVNGYLPSKVRVFTDEAGAFKPEILKEAMSVELDGLDRSKILDLLDKQNNEELYKYLLITQCNALNGGLPYMFEKIANWTELLFPANLLRNDSVLGRMVTDISEEDWTDQVQIIGWLYQYYNSELKDDTFNKLKKNVKISKERIPAATQLFTPDWIVRYMVENSLGRLWLEGHPNDNLKAEWKYYLEEAEQESDVEIQLAEIRKEYQTIKPEEIRIIDPCMGSGHILVAAFDVLMNIYTSCGWSERDAAKSIVENNLYGLDIDDRAGQLAYFSVMMKARKYNRRILNGEVKPNLMAITESGFMTDELVHYVAGENQELRESLTNLQGVFADAKEYGSILTIRKQNFTAIYDRLDAIEAEIPENLLDWLLQQTVVENLRPVIKQAEMLAEKYDVVVTNPPYMGGGGMDAKLSKYVKENYPDSKSDLFAVFIERCSEMTKANRFQAMITQHAWMFLSSYEKLRAKLLKTDIVNMAHLGARAFEEIGGEVVQTTSFVMQKKHEEAFKGTYCRLIESTTQQGKENMFLAGENRYVAQQANFAKIPGSPVAYWVGEAVAKKFENTARLEDYADPRQGLATGNDEEFLRFWQEVSFSLIGVGKNSIEDLWMSEKKYVPFNKGGSYRKWYGNNFYIIKFDKLSYKILSQQGNKLPSKQFYFKSGVTWSALTSGPFSGRYCGKGFVFAGKGPMCFSYIEQHTKFLCATMNSRPFSFFYGILSATMDFNQGPMRKLPYIDERSKEIELIVDKCIDAAMQDWDTYEPSWDFKRHPLV